MTWTTPNNAAPRQPEPPLPPAPAKGQTVRIPLAQLHEYLTTYGLRIARRVDLPGGDWRADLVKAADTSPEEDTEP